MDANWSCAQALIWIVFRNLNLVNAAAPGGIYRYARWASHGVDEGVWREVTPDIAPWLWARGPDGQHTVERVKEAWEQRYPPARKDLKRKLQSDALKAWGYGACGGQAEAIPAVFWADARFAFVIEICGMSAGVLVMDGTRFVFRTAVLGEHPPLATRLKACRDRSPCKWYWIIPEDNPPECGF